jgi:hypothetical protein
MRKAIVAALALGAMAAVPAYAEPNPFVRFFSFEPTRGPAEPAEFGGDRCGSVPVGADVWWGRFAGGKLSSTQDSRSGSPLRAEGCFTSRNACRAWMTALKTEYAETPIYNQCRLGYEPGAPIPPWWAPDRGA